MLSWIYCPKDTNCKGFEKQINKKMYCFIILI